MRQFFSQALSQGLQDDPLCQLVAGGDQRYSAGCQQQAFMVLVFSADNGINGCSPQILTIDRE